MFLFYINFTSRTLESKSSSGAGAIVNDVMYAVKLKALHVLSLCFNKFFFSRLLANFKNAEDC